MYKSKIYYQKKEKIRRNSSFGMYGQYSGSNRKPVNCGAVEVPWTARGRVSQSKEINMSILEGLMLKMNSTAT